MVHPENKAKMVKKYRVHPELAEAALVGNERLGYVRTRIEHQFNRSALGRFRRFGDWRGARKDLLGPAGKFAYATLNCELLLRHKDRMSKYAPMDQRWMEKMLNDTSDAPCGHRLHSDIPDKAMLRQLKEDKGAANALAKTVVKKTAEEKADALSRKRDRTQEHRNLSIHPSGTYDLVLERLCHEYGGSEDDWSSSSSDIIEIAIKTNNKTFFPNKKKIPPQTGFR
jgi:hypothetical protein